MRIHSVFIRFPVRISAFLFLFLLLSAVPVQAVVTNYQGESIEWNFEVVYHAWKKSGHYTFNPSLVGCSKQDKAGGVEMQCTYTADAPFYGDIYTVNAVYNPANGMNHSMWTTVKPYPNHEEYDFLSAFSDYYASGNLNHSFSSIFIPMWPEDVNTAYEIVIRYYSSDRTEGFVGFNIHILFWGFDPTSIPNMPWLKGEPGENPLLKFCGGRIRPEKRPGGQGY
jgi:hypothetical protein